MNTPLVAAENLWKTYAETTPVHALRGVDLKVQSGDFLALIGSSGSGKSTLLNMLGGLDVPSQGKVYFEGSPWITATRKIWLIFVAVTLGSSFRLFISSRR